MSIFIEQTQTEMQNSYAFSRRAEMSGVRVASASFSVLNILPLELEEPLSVAFRFSPHDASTGEGCVRATTLFECIITEPEAPEPVAKFECSLTATYNLHDNYVPSEAELAAFHKANVIFNCWPYFREFIQSSACRMNIPPPPVPFVRVQVMRQPLTPPAQPATKRARKALNVSR